MVLPRILRHRLQITRIVVALLAVVVAVVPPVLDGVRRATAPTEMQISAHMVCGSGHIPPDATVHYLIADQRSRPSEKDWEKADIVAVVSGQGLAPLKWPSLLKRNETMFRRYSIGAGWEETDLLVHKDPYWNAIRSSLTLGQFVPQSGPEFLGLNGMDARTRTKFCP